MKREHQHTGLLERACFNARLPEFAPALERLRMKAGEAFAVRFRMSAGDRGEWGHYYHCREDAGRLVFDWTRPGEHRCPVCGRVYTGQRYDACWIGLAHHSLGTGAFHMALCGSLDGREAYIRRVRDILLDYARYYAGWEIHGDIPYNGPGKLFAQTLDEAHWILDLGLAFLMVRSGFDAAEEEAVCRGLLRPCAEFLIARKEPQIHNHAVLITSAVSLLGFLLGDEEIHRAGLEGEYGLLDQLQRGVLEDGLWYEGVVHYHFYALHPILQYGWAVENTPWDNRGLEPIRRMLDFPLRFIQPDGSFLRRHDATSAVNIGTYAPYYELGLAWLGDARYRAYLKTAYGLEDAPALSLSGYRPVERDSVFALCFGTDLAVETGAAMEELRRLVEQPQSSAGSGLTRLPGTAGLHLTVKHGPFGGEHDHMDQLNISLSAYGIPLLEDAGTVPYAMPLHYGWFKHTFSHNTVAVNGMDQPPADGRRLGFGREVWGSWVCTAVDWKREDYLLKDRIVLPGELRPWHEPSYQGVELARTCLVRDNWVVDAVRVHLPDSRQADLLLHVDGALVGNPALLGEAAEEVFCPLDPALFRDPRRLRLEEGAARPLVWAADVGALTQYAWCSRPSTLLSAITPGNPAGRQRHTLVRRVEGKGVAVFLHFLHYDADGSAVGPPQEMIRAELGEDGRLTVEESPLGRMVLAWDGEAPVFG
ncbi:MAG: hypothetical protein K0Q90_442 [Paenibacillaceae bacterium]|jgi:hypothetical protein|nr:hypothetical protein [Paenibacillaceae bacterium]